MQRAAFLPCPTATVMVRSAGTMSPPAKTPRQPVIMSGATLTTPSVISSPWTSDRNDRSTSWPRARMSESASMVSNSPVGWGLPCASRVIFSTVNVPPCSALMVESQRNMMPSSIASWTSKS